MFLTIVEVKATTQRGREQMRRVLGAAIRDGDGIATEIDRLFLILATPEPSGARAAVARLTPMVAPLEGTLTIIPVGSDELADSVRRRAQAGFLPVAARLPKTDNR